MTPFVPTVPWGRRLYSCGVALLALLLAAAGLSAQTRRTEEAAPAKPAPVLTRQQALEQFRKLSAAERLQRVQKVAKDKQAFVPATRGNLAFTVTERGQIEAADAVDVICRVKARAQGSILATTVVSVIDDGTFVKQGDTLVTLDDSALKDQLVTQTISIELAAAAKVAAEENLTLVRKLNQLDVRTAEIALKEVALALKKVDGKNADEKELLTLKVELAKLALEVTQLQAKSKEATAAAQAIAKAAVVRQEEGRKKELLAEMRACVLKAPCAGLAVYYIPEQARWGVGSRQSIVARGEPVGEGQKLLQICGLKRYVVNTKVHEALVSRVRVGQTAVVRVDAFSDRPLRGHVSSVAHVASAESFLSADVKVFSVQIALDQTIPGLRPGANGEVRITIEEHKNVLSVPRQSVLRSGRAMLCYVKVDNSVEERAVTIGLHNDFLTAIKEGLKEGELVLRDPRAVASLSARPPAKVPMGGSGQAPGHRETQVLVRSVRADRSAAGRTRIETYGLTYKDLERIKRLPNVAAVVPVRSFPLGVKCRERSHKGQVIATVPSYRDVSGVQVETGRFLDDEDESRMRNVAVLGADAAERLFPDEDAVGKVVRLDRSVFVVIGVLREQGWPTDAQAAAVVNRGVFLPLRTCRSRFGKMIVSRNAGSWSAEAVALHEILVAARTPREVPLLVENLTTLLEESHPRKDWNIRSVAAGPQR